MIASGSTLPGALVAVADALGVAIPPLVKLLAAGSRGCLARVGGAGVSRDIGGDATRDTGSGIIEMTVSIDDWVLCVDVVDVRCKSNGCVVGLVGGLRGPSGVRGRECDLDGELGRDPLVGVVDSGLERLDTGVVGRS